MNIKTITRKAKRDGFKVDMLDDKTFRITDIRRAFNPVIKTDKKGLEIFIMKGSDDFVIYCEGRGIVAFV